MPEEARATPGGEQQVPRDAQVRTEPECGAQPLGEKDLEAISEPAAGKGGHYNGTYLRIGTFNSAPLCLGSHLVSHKQSQTQIPFSRKEDNYNIMDHEEWMENIG